MAFSFFGKKQETPKGTTVTEVPLSAIVPNRHQPRKVFTPGAISELAATIKEHGLLQPIVVREYEPEHYEIIAGERRFRAMQALKMETAPAIVQKMSDDESAEMALIENLQRENLSPIEEAQAYADLMRLNQLTQLQLADEMGKSQSFVANKLRLLKLSDPVQDAIMNGELSERHGRELLKVDDYHQQVLLHDILAHNLTVRDTEAAVEAVLHPEAAAAKVAQAAAAAAVAEPSATGKAKPKKPRRRTPITHDARMAVSTLRQSLKMIREAGLDVQATENESETGYHFDIVIPKPKKD